MARAQPAAAPPQQATLRRALLESVSHASLPVLTKNAKHISVLISAELLRWRQRHESASRGKMPGNVFARLSGRLETLSTADSGNYRRALELWDTYAQHVIPALGAQTGRCLICEKSAPHDHSDFNFKANRRRLRAAAAGTPSLGLFAPNDWLVRNAEPLVEALPKPKAAAMAALPATVGGACANWTAGKDNDRVVKGLAVTALGCSVCPHGYVQIALPISTGERPLHHT